MFKFKFIMPFVYGICTSYIILKYSLFTLEMNALTWGVYLLNLLTVYILSRLGKVFDKCLVQLFL